MLSFFKGLFTTKTNKASFPKISIGFRGEDLEYEIPNDSIHISTTWINGGRIHTDNIQYWKSNKIISDIDKAGIFRDILDFLNKRNKQKTVVVINVDHDKEFWESLCEYHRGQINSIEYQSDKEKEKSFYDSMLANIRIGRTFIDGNKIITTEEQFLDYWENRQKR